jgi:hypothetical protein
MEAVDGIKKHLRKVDSTGKAYFGQLIGGAFNGVFGHLVCFLPATLILGHYVGEMPKSHVDLAKEFLNVCYEMYSKQPTFLSPFQVQSIGVGDFIVTHPSNHLRPEFIESLYYFYAFTGNNTYQEMGWKIFEAFEKYAKVENGYSSINDVRSMERGYDDFLETFFFAETLKYFYLLFDDDPKLVDMNKYVFNTEAHLLPVKFKKH